MQEFGPKEYHRQIPHDPRDDSAISQVEEDIKFFEKQIICIHNLMISKGHLPGLSPIRRAAEEVDGIFNLKKFSSDIPSFLYDRFPEYGERRVIAVEKILCEMGLLSKEELNQELTKADKVGLSQTTQNDTYSPIIDRTSYKDPSYRKGDLVQVIPKSKPGHIRTPAYLIGKKGKILGFQGMFLNPEDIAHFRPRVFCLPLYLVAFNLEQVWGQACPQRSIGDKIEAEIYEPWLSYSE